jgi:hypothetical protein
VLVHETLEETRALVESALEWTEGPFELILVDNGSSAPVRDGLRELALETAARLVRLEDNLGFSAGSNVGWRAARGAEICLLNSDVILTPGWLRLLRAALHSAPDIGAVGPRSNFARDAQGGIWLDDPSPAGLREFGRFFNHHDPSRWFEPDWLMGFAILARRSALEQIGGFDELIPTFGGEDEDLSERLRAAGWRLLCAGDTFVYHSGHRTFTVAGVNRTATRLGRHDDHNGGGGGAGGNGNTPDGGRLVQAPNGWVFVVADGVACHVETNTTLRLIQGGRELEPAAPDEIEQLTLGPPIGLSRTADGDEVWVLDRGHRRRVTGDPHRIRRLRSVTVTARSELEALPEGAAVNVEDAVPPVPRLRPILPANPARLDKASLAEAEVVAAEVTEALAARHGYALIRLREAEAHTLDEGLWRDASISPELAAALRWAIIHADAVGVDLSAEIAPLLADALFHLDLYPRLRVDNGALSEPMLRGLLADRRVAIVSSASERDRKRVFGATVTVKVALHELAELAPCLEQLEARREDYDAVVIAAGVPGTVLASRAARALSTVAIDAGNTLAPSWKRGGAKKPKALPAPFILGSPRSGTTLLRLMLDAHPELAIPPESHFIPDLLGVWAKADSPAEAFADGLIGFRQFDKFHVDPDELRRRLTDPPVAKVGEAIRTFYRLYAETHGKPRWGDKTPVMPYIRIMPTISRKLPEAHFIHVIRDGRDVASSLRTVWFGPSGIEDSAEFWVKHVERARQRGTEVPHYTEVFYEELATQPEPVLRRLCEELALEFDPVMLRYHERAVERLSEDTGDYVSRSGRTIPAEERYSHHGRLQKPANASQVGRWRTEMTPDEQRRFFEIAGGTLQDFGYPPF